MEDEDRHAADERRQMDERRLSALESELAALRAEVVELRRLSTHVEQERPSGLARLHLGARARASRHALTGDQLESWVGRYGTLASGAAVILLGVGTLIVWAVNRGLLRAEVRVAGGVLTAIGVATAGLHFRRKGEQRYGNVLLALALAITDVVAWGAGPQLHLVPTGAALIVVDVVALMLAALAVHDESEFLFAIAVAGALSAPFVTADRPGAALTLLAYGATVSLGALRAARDPEWRRAMALLVLGAAAYTVVTASLPIGAQWYGPFLIPLFGGVLSLGALLLAEHEWRGIMARAYLAVTLVGVMIGWDAVATRPIAIAAVVSLVLAATTYSALGVREPRQPWWVASALMLPLLSLGVASAAARGQYVQSELLGLWGVFAFGAAWAERRRGDAERSGAHLLVAGLLVTLGILDALWSRPLGVVAALAGWGCVMAYLARDEKSPLPTLAIAIALYGGATAALDQLASLRPYAYTPFASRPSASALAETVGLAVASVVLARGSGVAPTIFRRGVRLGSVIGFVFLWGRMELVHAYSLDAGTFLLTLYYAAVGVGSIIAGRRWALPVLRVGGLALAIYAAAKAVVEATAIGALSLRVGCYAAVGVFLFGAGYLYRNAILGSPGTAAGEEELGVSGGG
jgi:predicted membrane protein DUF2339